MPEDFTWSCKRRYKKSYVWRDLLDDDHEYVLKGSQMRSNSNSSFDANSYLYGKKACCALSNSQQAAFQLNQNTKMNNIQISKTSSSVPERSSNLQGEQEEDDYSQWSSTINHKSHNSFFYSNLSKVNVVDNKYKHDMASSTTTSSSSSSHSSSQSQPTQPQSESIPLAGKRTKSRHLSMFRNLIHCGGVEDTNDAAFVGLNPTNTRQHIIKADLRRKKRENSYIGLFGTCMNYQVQPQQWQKHTPARKNDDGEYGATKQAKNQRADSSAFRPIGGPHCSHCRKQFNPEKLHSHMKSCIGVKVLSKAAAVSVENKMP